MTRENLLRFVVCEALRPNVELVIEKRESGRYYMILATNFNDPAFDGGVRVEVEMTPGLLQELRRTMGKIA